MYRDRKTESKERTAGKVPGPGYGRLPSAHLASVVNFWVFLFFRGVDFVGGSQKIYITILKEYREGKNSLTRQQHPVERLNYISVLKRISLGRFDFLVYSKN